MQSKRVVIQSGGIAPSCPVVSRSQAEYARLVLRVITPKQALLEQIIRQVELRLPCIQSKNAFRYAMLAIIISTYSASLMKMVDVLAGSNFHELSSRRERAFKYDCRASWREARCQHKAKAVHYESYLMGTTSSSGVACVDGHFQ